MSEREIHQLILELHSFKIKMPGQFQVKQQELRVGEHTVVHKVKKIKKEKSRWTAFLLPNHNFQLNIHTIKYMDLMKHKKNYFCFFNKDLKD